MKCLHLSIIYKYIIATSSCRVRVTCMFPLLSDIPYAEGQFVLYCIVYQQDVDLTSELSVYSGFKSKGKNLASNM